MAAKQKTRKPKKARSLSPRTEPANPEQSLARLTFVSANSGGVRVTEDTALTQSAVWACVRVISETLAGMPWNVGRLIDYRTVEPLLTHPTNFLLNFAPNEETTAFTFRETIWAHALIWGNGYAEIERDFADRPYALWQIHPSRVVPVRSGNDELYYQVWNYDADPTYLPARDMYHLKGPSPDGLVGWSVIRLHARTIGLAIAQEQNAASLNENDSTPGGILKHPARLTDTARKNLEQSWNSRHKGPSKRRTIAILEENMDWKQTGLPPEDMQLLEQMQLTPAMIARIFRVPVHKIAAAVANSSGTYNNVENQDLEFAKDTLRPWAERGEGEADIKLFGRNNQANLVTMIDMSERERGDTTAQTGLVKDMIFHGVWSINEGRRYLGYRGIGPEGDRHFVQSAMIPIEMAGQQQQASPKPQQDNSESDQNDPESDSEDASNLKQIKSACEKMLGDACQRIEGRERGQREQQGKLPDEWLTKHAGYCRKVLTSPAEAFGATCGASVEAVDIALELFIAGRIELLKTADTECSDGFPNLMRYITAAASAKGAA